MTRVGRDCWPVSRFSVTTSIQDLVGRGVVAGQMLP
ncbi:hypothetical protein DSM25558_1366 [Agrobacterium sp. DSM 25558]|nr:hypothetical protein DSM25558_1366 [Agrobacterium sp. DSM 25558]